MMKKVMLPILLGVCSICFVCGCSEFMLELEREDLLFADLQSVEKKKKELPAEFQDVPQQVKEVLDGINETTIGEGLLNKAAEALRRVGGKHILCIGWI